MITSYRVGDRVSAWDYIAARWRSCEIVAMKLPDAQDPNRIPYVTVASERSVWWAIVRLDVRWLRPISVVREQRRARAAA